MPQKNKKSRPKHPLKESVFLKLENGTSCALAPEARERLKKTASARKWQGIGLRRRAGILAPLFCLHSRESVGIGDLGDLRLLIDWAARTGNSLIQLLPMNEMGPLFCPYDSLSSFALEPAYISLRDIPQARAAHIQKKIDLLKKMLPAGKTYVDYGIKKEKAGLLREVFSLEKDGDFKARQEFRRVSSYWLDDFVLFKVLKDHHGGRPWYEWEEEYKNRHPKRLEDFRQQHQDEIDFQLWLQWQLFRQLKAIKQYAFSRGVLLKGDLPVLVSRDSADVWSHPEFFKLEFAAGAPPDMYCAKGQRWGMPTYNWDNIALDAWRYLRAKLRYAQEFYDILRIDHVVGLFRIWSIPCAQPPESQGLHGFFDPPQEDKWGEQGKNILSVMLESTHMLLCAEDLGVIPAVCTRTLEQLGIPGNDVQRWAKDWKVRHDFLLPQEYRLFSVTMLSTHDTTNWPAWWEFEAGTIDEQLFIRRCCDHRQIACQEALGRLFDLSRCHGGRLRWRREIDSADKLIHILGRKKEDLQDFIDIYQNSYQEKEKFWKQLGESGPLRETSDPRILRSAFELNLKAQSIFCINSIFDLLSLAGLLKDSPRHYRINTPGETGCHNWSVTIPVPLEELLDHKSNPQLKETIARSGRI